jgi:hypothetical protein
MKELTNVIQAKRDSILNGPDAKWMLAMGFQLKHNATIAGGWVWHNEQYDIVEIISKPHPPFYIATLWADRVAQFSVKKNQETLRSALMGAIGLAVDIVEDDNYNDVARLKVQS